MARGVSIDTEKRGGAAASLRPIGAACACAGEEAGCFCWGRGVVDVVVFFADLLVDVGGGVVGGIVVGRSVEEEDFAVSLGW